MELKKIGILSAAKIAGLFGVIYGLFSGILISILVSKADLVPGLQEQLGLMATLGYKSIIILPILNGIIYFIAGIILALIYNLLASWVGGIKLEFKEPKEQAKKK